MNARRTATGDTGELALLPVIHVAGPSGGAGGEAFHDQIPADARVSAIHVQRGRGIEGVAIEFRAGDRDVLVRRGACDGDCETIAFAPDEHVAAIAGRCGERVEQLVVRTNLRDRRFGEGAGRPFLYEIASGLDFAGFVGRASSSLEAIGCVYRARRGVSPRPGTYVKVGSSGTSVGLPFEDARLPPGKSIARVRVLYGGGIVAGIGFDYRKGACEVAGPTHGGPGPVAHEIVLGEDEYVTAISGRFGDGVRAIRFSTSARPEGEELGGADGVPFRFDLGPDYELVGLFGQSTERIEALGALFRSRSR